MNGKSNVEFITLKIISIGKTYLLYDCILNEIFSIPLLS